MFCRRGSAALGQFAAAMVSSRFVTDLAAIAYNTNHNLSINPTGGTFALVQGGQEGTRHGDVHVCGHYLDLYLAATSPGHGTVRPQDLRKALGMALCSS